MPVQFPLTSEEEPPLTAAAALLAMAQTEDPAMAQLLLVICFRLEQKEWSGGGAVGGVGYTTSAE